MDVVYFETGDWLCVDLDRSRDADHASVIQYSVGNYNHYVVTSDRVLSVL